MKKTNYTATVTALAIVLGSSIPASAALISVGGGTLISAGGNVTLTSSTTIETPGGIAEASDGFISDQNASQVYTDSPGNPYFDFAPPVVFDLNLGSAYSIDSIAFWNRTDGTANSVASFSAVFSTNSTFGDVDDTSAYSFSPLHSGNNQQNFALGTTVNNAQYVQIAIDAINSGDRVGFNEFQFNAVPEPSSTALFGLGGIALLLRRRR